MLKDEIRDAIGVLVSEAQGTAKSGEFTDGNGKRAENLSQAALNLAATLAQIVNVDDLEAHISERKAYAAAGMN
jgi:hypothetical protein